MLRPAGRAFSDDPPLLHAVVEMMPKIREAGNEMEQMRRIPPHIAEAMKETGVFGMVLPRSWGAPELDPLTQIRAIEALAIAEGSAGWCAMIGCDSGYITASRRRCRSRDVPGHLGRHRSDGHRDGSGDAGAWRLSSERPFSFR